MKYLSYIVLLWGSCCFTACKKDEVAISAKGIEFNPIRAYQEALPGSIATFKVRVKTTEPVTRFGLRFKFPNTTDYVALPAYPDLSQPAEFTPGFGVFEYALPPAAAATTAEMKFKFTASTASQSYESEYTVKMVSLGERRARLYNPGAASFFKFSGLDLLSSTGVPAAAPDATKDLLAATFTVTNNITNQRFTVLSGFTSGNGTKFKLATLAQYNAVAQYAAAYASIAAANEFNGASTLGGVPATGTGLLVAGTFYIAKINRGGVFSYAGISLKKIPSATSAATTASSIDMNNEFLEAEIKK
ncbi:MAG: hypothetical protein ABWY16_21095 [Pedobacter sp.]|uniref:hypothetical protein n=1 Tax=Pedobacter sp. TaxID=1411316 RepID=UPI00339667B2